MPKRKASETGFQTASAGAAGTTALVGLDVSGAAGIDVEHILITAGVGVAGLLYRLAVKWLDQRVPTVRQVRIHRDQYDQYDEDDGFGGER